MKKALIVGPGKMAMALKARLEEKGVQVPNLVGRDFYTSADGERHSREGLTLGQLFAGPKPKLETPHLVFITTSTKDRGEAARDYIIDSAEAGVARIITCEKGSLAYHADVLNGYVCEGTLRFTAGVSGGAQFIKVLKDRHLNEHRVDLQMVVNGTCNFIFDKVAGGDISFPDAAGLARKFGYAEPEGPEGGDDFSLINGEMPDVAMKACKINNMVLTRGGFITPDDLGPFQLDRAQFAELAAHAGRYRMVVSFCNYHQPQYAYFDGLSFRVKAGPWSIQGGFRDTSMDSELASWLPHGVLNKFRLWEGDKEDKENSPVECWGRGAGLTPTTTAMINDMFAN